MHSNKSNLTGLLHLYPISNEQKSVRNASIRWSNNRWKRTVIFITNKICMLLKIKVLKKIFQAMPWKKNVWFHKEPFFKEPSLPCLFIIWRTFFRQQVKDAKGSLWNPLDNKVILWHREREREKMKMNPSGVIINRSERKLLPLHSAHILRMVLGY